MASDPSWPSEPAGRYSLSTLLAPAALMRLGIIALVLLGVVSAFAWTAGWLSPGRLDQVRLIDTFEEVNDAHPGFRRNHAKGVCLVGWFGSNGAGARLSGAAVFAAGRIPVVGRLSIVGPSPEVADGSEAVRSMALDFTLPDGEAWRTSMNDLPVFPVKDAQGFYEQLVALKPDPATGKPDPVRVAAFLSAHPESARAIALIKGAPSSSGFANATYNGLNAFRFVDADGKATPVRWSMRPVDAFEPEPAETPREKNYLFDALTARLRQGPAQWHLILVIGQPGDPTSDATLPWSADHETIDAGTLTVARRRLEAQIAGVWWTTLVVPSVNAS